MQPGNDGLVIMPDGTKYVSSVVQGGVSRIRPGQPAELIAQNIPNPASMCYDAGANQLVIPMNANNATGLHPAQVEGAMTMKHTASVACVVALAVGAASLR